MFCARLQAAGSMSEASVHATGVVPKEKKGYADSAALNERPDFDRSKIKQNVRKLAVAPMGKQCR
jgi:hypothetical protein